MSRTKVLHMFDTKFKLNWLAKCRKLDMRKKDWSGKIDEKNIEQNCVLLYIINKWKKNYINNNNNKIIKKENYWFSGFFSATKMYCIIGMRIEKKYETEHPCVV